MPSILPAGHDPYADAIAVQNIFHSQIASHPNAPVPYSYVYSPITLPLLRLIAPLPFLLSGGVYLLVYVAASWPNSGPESGRPPARTPLLPLPRSHCPVLSRSARQRNSAWRQCRVHPLRSRPAQRYPGLEAPFLDVVLPRDPGCFLRQSSTPKPRAHPHPLQSQTMLSTAATLGAGGLPFRNSIQTLAHALQPLPRAGQFQFIYNHDFGCSPAGVLSDLAYARGLPFSRIGLATYFACALPVLAILFYLSRRFLNDRFSLKQWVPVLLVGIVLLNPRLIEYDVAPLTIPLALICWRSLEPHRRRSALTAGLGVLFLACNIVSIYSWRTRKFLDGPLLVLLFLLWMLEPRPAIQPAAVPVRR